MDRIEQLARTIALWHGQKIVYIAPRTARGGGPRTVAAMHGFSSGFAWENERYVEAHWQEYLPAAKAVLATFEPDYVG